MTEIDERINAGLTALKQIFSSIVLSPREKQFVDDAGVKIAEYTYDLLVTLPTDVRGDIRPFIIAVAIASILGPDTCGFGADVLAQKNKAPPV